MKRKKNVNLINISNIVNLIHIVDSKMTLVHGIVFSTIDFCNKIVLWPTIYHPQ